MQKLFTIGVTGGSGSGKTYFINALAKHFKPGKICFVSQDHYYKNIELQTKDAKGVYNFDLPTAIHRQRFHDDILKIKQGQTVKISEYVFNNSAMKPGVVEFRPAPLLVIEGLFVQYFEEISAELDLKIFLEAKDEIRLSRRLRRDQEARGYDPHDVLYRFHNHILPVYQQLIEPLKHEADLIIPNNRDFSRALDVLVMALKSKLTGQ